MKCMWWFFLREAWNIIILSEHNQFIVNSIKNFLSSIKNDQVKVVFAYFHNDSCKVPWVPLKRLLDFKNFLYILFFFWNERFENE